MKTLKYILALSLVFSFISCSNKIEKPLVTIQKFSFQKVQMNEVLNKLMNEKDVKVMYMMADGIESTRAVDCSPIGEECNLYYGIINKVVNLTRDNELSDDDRKVLLEMHNAFNSEMKSSELKLKQQWKDFINMSSKRP